MSMNRIKSMAKEDVVGDENVATTYQTYGDEDPLSFFE
jgi:hypothetical protein